MGSSYPDRPRDFLGGSLGNLTVLVTPDASAWDLLALGFAGIRVAVSAPKLPPGPTPIL
jgi:hypothetical protein